MDSASAFSEKSENVSRVLGVSGNVGYQLGSWRPSTILEYQYEFSPASDSNGTEFDQCSWKLGFGIEYAGGGWWSFTTEGSALMGHDELGEYAIIATLRGSF